MAAAHEATEAGRQTLAPLPRRRDVEPTEPTSIYARVGFGVPMGIAVLASLWGFATTYQDTSGYGGLVFIFFLMVGVPATLLWMGIGALVLARGSAPKGSARSFALGAGLALALMIILFSATCFASYA